MPPAFSLPVLLHNPWFAALSAGLRRDMLAATERRHLQPGEMLFRQGHAPDGFYALLQGKLKMSTLNQDGREAILTILDIGTWFGEISLIDGQPRTHDAYAEGPARLLQVPQAALQTLLAREPGYWRDFALLMSQKLRLAFIALEEMSLLPAAPRLARRLLMMAEGYGETGPRRVLHLAQEQLALMLGLSRQTTNQILKELEARGALRLTYGEIEISDLAILRQAAGVI